MTREQRRLKRNRIIMWAILVTLIILIILIR